MRALGLLLLLCACTPDFQSVSQITDLRVLAVQAEPPEALFDQNHVDDVTIRVLAVDPYARANVRINARLCAPTDNRLCQDGPVFPLDTLDRPAGANISWLLKLPPEVVAYALQNDDLKGLGGVRVMLSMDLDDLDPAGKVYASKFLVYSPSGHTPNHNPVISGIRLTRDGQDSGVWDPAGSLKLTPGESLGLRPTLADGSIEEYDTIDLKGNPVHLKEQPRWNFFTSQYGDLDRDTADEPLDGVAPPDGLTRITALKAGTGTLWIVVRDGRGGESWLTVPWTTF
jgi:hypothetical protein